MVGQFYLGQEEKMGSLFKTKAYGKKMSINEKNKIDNYNAQNRNEGKTKDENWQAQRESVAQKSGTVEYKNIIRRHMQQIGSILGVKSRS